VGGGDLGTGQNPLHASTWVAGLEPLRPGRGVTKLEVLGGSADSALPTPPAHLRGRRGRGWRGGTARRPPGPGRPDRAVGGIWWARDILRH